MTKIPEEVQNLVSSSGNNFHAKVARWLSDHEWHVVVSPYYMDQSQNKAREIDLVAERLWPTTDYSGRKNGEVVVRLFIECKYVPSYSVFWFAQKNYKSAMDLLCSNAPFKPRNSYTEKHHYISEGKSVAKLFATNVKKEQENEPFYKALNQALSAMTSMSPRPISVPGYTPAVGSLKGTLEMPVVVCSTFDPVFSVDFYSDNPPSPIKDNFQLEIDYAYIDKSGNHRNRYFLLDFVEFKRLDKYMAAVEEGAKSMAFLASR